MLKNFSFLHKEEEWRKLNQGKYLVAFETSFDHCEDIFRFKFHYSTN